MALLIPQGYATVIHSLTWTNDPEPMAVTYGVQLDPVVNPIVASDIATEAADAFADNVMPLLSSILTLTSTECRIQVDPPPTPPVVAISSQSQIGGDVEANVIPQNSAYLIHKRTLFGGRGGRGRMYLPGVGETDVDNFGNIASAKITAANTALAAFLTDLAAGPQLNGMVILHDSTGAYAAETPFLVTSLVMDPKLSTQRRRLRR